MAIYTQKEIIGILDTYFSTFVPPAVSTASLTAFDSFLKRPPTDDSKLQFCTYLAEGFNYENTRNDAFIVHVQLPGIEDPSDYLDVIWPLVLKVDPTLAGYNTKDQTWQTWYPGEIGGGGSSSFVYFEIGFTSSTDDCFIDDSDL